MSTEIVVDLSEANLLQDFEKESILKQFICQISGNVAFYPVKCISCEAVFCKTSLPAEALTLPSNEKEYTCPAKCGAKAVKPLGRLEMRVLNSLTFQSPYGENGSEAISYEDYKKHLAKLKIEFTEEPKLEMPPKDPEPVPERGEHYESDEEY